jgi:hypothetical protein
MGNTESNPVLSFENAGLPALSIFPISIEKSEISKPSVPERLPTASIKDQPLAKTDAVRVTKAPSFVSFKTGSENPETDDEGSDGSDDDRNFHTGHEHIYSR